MSGTVEISPGVTVDRKVRFGKPVVKGTRITAAEVLDYLAAGDTYDDLHEHLGLDREQILAVLGYAAEMVSEDVIRAH